MKTELENEMLPGTIRELKLIKNVKKRIASILASIPEAAEIVAV